jgi:parallel beta-helix repeat protein
VLDAIRLRGRRLPVIFSVLFFTACGSSSDGGSVASTASSPPESPSSLPSIPAPQPTPVPVTAPATSPVQTSGVTRYVNPSNAMSKDNGAGTSAAPYKTLGYAIKQLRRGDTLLISGGTYRESVDLRLAAGLASSSSLSGPLTKISGVTGSTVVIKGSEVIADWEKLNTNTYVRRGWTTNSQQVFVDGAPLKQIGGSIFGGYPDKAGNAYASILSGTGGIWPGRISGTASALVDNSFYYDAAGAALYVRVPLATLVGHIVEASVRTYAIFGSDVHDLAIANLRIEHSNTTATVQNGAVTLLGSRLQLDHMDVKYADGAGFDVTADDSTVKNVSATYCGQVGVKLRGSRSKLLDSTVSYNNTRGFNKWWEAGGAKFVGAGGLQDSVVAGNRAYFNTGDGLWFDYKNARNKIYGNNIAYNSGMGVHYEASTAAEIYRNRIFGNGQRGIYLPNSSNSVIAHNLIVHNGLEGIAIVDERGATAQMNTAFIPSNNYLAANIIGWNGKAAIVLPGEGEKSVSDANLFLGVSPPTFSLGWASTANPLLTGIAAWLAATGHDMESWHRSLVEPAGVAMAIQQKSTTPDFSAIDSIAAEYTVPIAKLPKPVPPVVSVTPGPK